MPMAVAVGALVVSAVGTGISYANGRTAAKNAQTMADAQAATELATAGYNARVDRAEEKQVDLNTVQNIRDMRKDAKTYLSRQEAAYTGAGVMANTGSALASRVATAGALALREQQVHIDANAKMQRIESAAQAGIAEGAAAASADQIGGASRAAEMHAQGTADLLAGASRLGMMGYDFYQQGAFSSPNTSVALDVPAATPANTGDFNMPANAGGYA